VIASGHSFGTPWLAEGDGPIPDVAREQKKVKNWQEEPESKYCNAWVSVS
jgi:hypothetical protein